MGEGEYCAEAKNWYDYALDVCLRENYKFFAELPFFLSSGGVYKKIIKF